MELKKIVGAIIDCMFKIATKNNKHKADALMKSCCTSYEKVTNDFCSFRYRSGTGTDVVVNQHLVNLHSDKAIILQGPLLLENHFTLNTVKLYHSLYPECKIIVSTWKNENEEEIKAIEEAGAVIVQGDLPEKTGLGNMNYQIVSTQRGIILAESLGAEYVLKTRTDQRLYKSNILDYFESLQKTFPVKGKQKARIIVFQGTVGGVMFIPYFIADFLYYGSIADIRNMFDIELSDLNLAKEDRLQWLKEIRSKNPTIHDYYNMTAPEIIIIKNYVSKYINSNMEDTVEEYWDFVRDFLITVSWDDIGMFWPKYERYNESKFYRISSRYDDTNIYYQYTWTFNNWLLLYTGAFKYDSSLEDYSKQSCDKLNLNL